MRCPGLTATFFCGRFRSLPRSGCTPEPRVRRVFEWRHHPGCTTCPGRIGRVQGNDTRRRSPSPQQPAVCLCPYGTPRISVSEHAGVVHDLRLDRSVMCGTKPRVRRRPLLRSGARRRPWAPGYNRFAVKTSTVPVQWVTCGTEMNNITKPPSKSERLLSSFRRLLLPSNLLQNQSVCFLRFLPRGHVPAAGDSWATTCSRIAYPSDGPTPGLGLCISPKPGASGTESLPATILNLE